MKSDVMPSIVEKSILNSIVEVKETLATGLSRGRKNRRSFGAVDIWNIRRNARSATRMVRI
jgi:hypothetical protein